MIRVNVHEWPRWVLDLLHIDIDEIPEKAQAWIAFKRFPESGWGLFAVLAIAAGCAYAAWVYRRETSLSTARKVFFTSIRCAALLAVALALFAPVLEVSVEREQKAVTLVFFDDSLSFGIADAYRSDAALAKRVADAAGVAEKDLATTSRAEIARALLDNAEDKVLGRLAARNLLKVFAFSDSARSVTASEPSEPVEKNDTGDAATGVAPPDGVADGEGPMPNAVEHIPAPAIEPRGPVTDLGLAVRSVVEAQGATPVAAVVVVTDGKVTAGEDPAGLGLFLAERGIPVWSIGVGDPTPTRNVRVMAVFAPERAFLDDPIAVDVRLDHRGFAGQTVAVELLRGSTDDIDGAGAETIGKEEIELGADAEATARFQIPMDRLGAQRLIARVAPVEGETFEHDNEREVRVDVVEQATRVLLVAGAPSNEFRALRNLLRRDRRVHLAAWLMSADPDSPQEGNVILEKLPSSPKELFAYDVVILADPSPEGFPPRFIDELERFVGKHRGGLAYIAGEKYTARILRSSDMKPLRALLAVEPDSAAVQDEYGRGAYHTREWPILPTSEAMANAATRLSSRPERNRERWAELSGIYWSLPVRRAKPAATVLLEHPNPRFASNDTRRALLAYQFYEGGRSLFLGFDETWRWRALSEEIYDQFWMQIVRTLTEGRLLGDRRQLVLTDRETYGLGEVVRVSALVQDEDYQPSTAESVEIEVHAPDGVERVTLDSDPMQAGWFRGVFMPRRVGALSLRLQGGAEKAITVEVPDLEYQDPRLDVATLEELARLTAGGVVPIDAVATLPEKIPDRSEKVVKTDEPRPLWDNAITLALVVGLLTLEWILRKWSRLP